MARLNKPLFRLTARDVMTPDPVVIADDLPLREAAQRLVSRRVAELRNEIEVDEQVQRLCQHARRDRCGHGDHVPGYRALGQVAHESVRWYTRPAAGPFRFHE